MLAQDVAPNRLAAAKKAAGTFLEAMPDKVRVGAVAFNHRAEVLQSPTRDHDAVREALTSIKAAGSTATGDAIKSALGAIKGNAPAAIVLLSDGKSVRGSDPVQAAQEAKQRKIPIYTVALGTADGHHQRRRAVPPDRRTLAEIAKVTGAHAFTASGSTTAPHRSINCPSAPPAKRFVTSSLRFSVATRSRGACRPGPSRRRHRP